jgi:magnesium-transporting ATPase (P-type)
MKKKIKMESSKEKFKGVLIKVLIAAAPCSGVILGPILVSLIDWKVNSLLIILLSICIFVAFVLVFRLLYYKVTDSNMKSGKEFWPRPDEGTTYKINKDGEWIEVPWENLRTGDLLKLDASRSVWTIPADIIIGEISQDPTSGNRCDYFIDETLLGSINLANITKHANPVCLNHPITISYSTNNDPSRIKYREMLFAGTYLEFTSTDKGNYIIGRVVRTGEYCYLYTQFFKEGEDNYEH